MKILHIISDLSIGGAQRMLCKLISSMDRDRYSFSVLSLKGKGDLGADLKRLGVPIHSLHLPVKISSLAFGIVRLQKSIRQENPDLIQGWMYHGNLASSVGSGLSGRSRPVLWNIRHSLHHLKREKSTIRLLIRLGARLSSQTSRIVYNSGVSAEHHEALGYDSQRTVIIPNGFDCDLYRPYPGRQAILRRELGLSDSELVIGHAARYHPMKDHDVFLQAASLFSRHNPDARFVLDLRARPAAYNHAPGKISRHALLHERNRCFQPGIGLGRGFSQRAGRGHGLWDSLCDH